MTDFEPPVVTQPPGPVAAATTSDERTWALFAHIGPIVAGFVAPLVIYLVKRDESPFIRRHAAEALNFQITAFVLAIIAIPLLFVIIGFFLLLAIAVCSLVFGILGAIAANNGEDYRYPINFRIIK